MMPRGEVSTSFTWPEMFEAIQRGSTPWYRHKLTQHWVPAMPDVKSKLEAGGSMLDVGCGSGLAAIAIAKAFPSAKVFGYDNHAGSIARARANAKAAGVGKHVAFKVMDAKRLRGPKLDSSSPPSTSCTTRRIRLRSSRRFAEPSSPTARTSCWR